MLEANTVNTNQTSSKEQSDLDLNCLHYRLPKNISRRYHCTIRHRECGYNRIYEH